MTRALGVVIVAAHAAAFVALAGECRGAELAVELGGPGDGDGDGDGATAGATVPAALAARVVAAQDGAAPGLVRRTWTVRYRGGHERAVGAARLVGPFQDPAARACVGRVVVAQRLLDDGRAGPGTIAGEVARLLDAELRGEGFFPAGDYERVEAVTLYWAELERNPQDAALVPAAPRGYVRVTATLVFERVRVPVVVALVPKLAGGELAFDIHARAELDLGNRALQWVSDKIGGDRLATRLARRQLDGAVITALAPPPPLELPGGQRLTFDFCGEPPDIRDGAWGALAFAVGFGRVEDPAVLPPRRGPAPRRAIAPDAALAIDVDLDGLDALLFELWRTGFLERRLAEAGLDRRFNADPIVTEYLSIRLSPLALALPPVLAATPTGLRLAAEARVAIEDGATSTPARVWGALELRIGPGPLRAPARAPSVELGALALSCERTATTLVPCYADLVAAVRERGPAFHDELTQAFTALLDELFTGRRVGGAGAGLPAELVIRAARPSVTSAAGNASLHLDLDAAVVAPP